MPEILACQTAQICLDFEKSTGRIRFLYTPSISDAKLKALKLANAVTPPDAVFRVGWVDEASEDGPVTVHLKLEAIG